MSTSIEIQPAGPVRGTVRPPGSKSLTNRALVCAALAEGTSVLAGALDSEDTRVMVASLTRLGIAVEHDAASATLRVAGASGRIPSGGCELYVANSGTTMRFLTALLTLGRGVFRVAGVERMHRRPIGDLLEALGQLGADVRSAAGNGCPPVLVHATGLPGGAARVAGDVSSQFLSGLLMAAPYAKKPVELIVAGELVSKPYVTMTLAVMESFGVAAVEERMQRFVVPVGRGYRGRTYAIEPDASAASYFLAAAAVTRGCVTVEGLGSESLQGDVGFADCLAQMGCAVLRDAHRLTVVGRPLRGIDVNMNAISDTVQTLAVVALFAEGPTTIRGVGHIRHKETDRIGDLAVELRKLGATVEELPDGLRITPGEFVPATIDTYNDHRMAMSFAVAGLAAGGVVIRDPECCAKTYPRFFDDLARLCAE